MTPMSKARCTNCDTYLGVGMRFSKREDGKVLCPDCYVKVRVAEILANEASEVPNDIED